jgi:hypothetical protein
MKTYDSPDIRARLEVVNTCEREFLVVWKALHMIRLSSSFNDLLRLEVDRAADTLLYLMRVTESIDPTVVLDGTRGLSSSAADL